MEFVWSPLENDMLSQFAKRELVQALEALNANTTEGVPEQLAEGLRKFKGNIFGLVKVRAACIRVEAGRREGGWRKGESGREEHARGGGGEEREAEGREAGRERGSGFVTCPGGGRRWMLVSVI